MSELKIYPQVQLMHKCIVFSLWTKLIKKFVLVYDDCLIFLNISRICFYIFGFFHENWPFFDVFEINEALCFTRSSPFLILYASYD
jgi:hypothetical protein